MTTRNSPQAKASEDTSKDVEAPDDASTEAPWIAVGDMTVEIGKGRKALEFKDGEEVKHADLPKGWPSNAVIDAGFVRRPDAE